jgi:hypothetical protein
VSKSQTSLVRGARACTLLLDKEPDKFCIWVVKYLQDMAGKDLDEAISCARVYATALVQNALHQSTLLGLLAEFESKKEVLQPQPMRPTNKQRRKSRSAMVWGCSSCRDVGTRFVWGFQGACVDAWLC